MVDKRARKILFDTYWGPQGWKTDRQTNPADLAYAKSVGMMFDDVCPTHNDLVARAVSLVRRLSLREVVDAFLASLGSRRLDLRSAIGSYAVIRRMPTHGFTGTEKFCSVCHQHKSGGLAEDLNVLNFERHKWGGVRHSNLVYAVFDLEQFETVEKVEPTADDIERFTRIIDACRSAPENTTASTLHKQFAKIVKSNKDERDTIIAILGFCGVLATAEHPGYRERFVPYGERQVPSRRFVDMSYPVCWWTSADGVNSDALAEWFAHRIS